MMISKTSILCFSCLLVLLACLPASAEQELDADASAPHSLHIDPADLSSFADGVFKAQMRSFHIPGATFSVVAGRRMIMSKGYGVADMDTGRPVDPGRTLFRVGSVSKLMVWTSVMQLAELGRIDLDADVNEYIQGFTIPPAFDKPVTMAMLMAHAPGFEDRAMGLMREKAEDLMPLERHLAEHMPARVMPPGEATSYSNYGTSLAAHIVAVVSGMDFNAYVQEHIFDPLGMNHSTFSQPPPPDLASDMAVGYKYEAGRYLAKPFEYVQEAPAGAMSSTAQDMAAFMAAHLNNGRLSGGRLLEPGTARRMHSRLFANTEELAGMAHGFYELNVAGRRMIVHEGDTLWFHTLLALDPEMGFGLFVSYNSPGGVKARRALLRAVAERYLPGIPPDGGQKPVVGLAPPLAEFAGWYAVNRSSRTTIEKVLVLGDQRRVTPVEEGVLLVDGLFSSKPVRWVRTGPDSFVKADGLDRMVFKPLDDGGMRLFVDSLPIVAFERQPWYATVTFAIGLAGACALVFLAGAVAWPLAALTGRRRTIFGKARPTFRAGKLVAWPLCLLNLVFPIMAMAAADDPRLMYGMTGQMARLLYLPQASAVLTLLMVFACAWAWFKSLFTLGGRFFYTLVLVAAVAWLWLMYYWNILGFNY